LSWTQEGAGAEFQALLLAGKVTEHYHEDYGEGKLPKSGVVSFVYTSDPKTGCVADITEREQLGKFRYGRCSHFCLS
jgi:hypothetical protein